MFCFALDSAVLGIVVSVCGQLVISGLFDSMAKKRAAGDIAGASQRKATCTESSFMRMCRHEASGHLFVCAGAKERAKYAAKIRFINKHFRMEDPFEQKTRLDDDLLGAVEWMAARSNEQVCMLYYFLGSYKLAVCISAGAGRMGRNHGQHRGRGSRSSKDRCL